MAIFLPLTKYFFGGKIWIETINHTKSYGRNSLMKTLETKKAPAAIGPYSQAKMTGNFLFASGQIPVDPATGEVAGDKIETQAEQSCKILHKQTSPLLCCCKTASEERTLRSGSYRCS